MYKCCDCDEVFSTPKTDSECIGEYYGQSAYESYGVCPHCESRAYDEAEKCDECGEWFFECETTDGLCDECRQNIIDEKKNDPVFCWGVAQNHKECEPTGIKINSFLASVYSVQEIEELIVKDLYSHLECGGQIDCSAFINEDKDFIIEKVKEMKANENTDEKS